MKRSKWIGLLSLLLVLPACSSAPDEGDRQQTPVELTELTPAPTQDVEEVTWNLPWGEPTSLDPTKSYYYPENTVLANMCESLLRELPDYSFAPGLAESYSNPDPVTWVYDIRPGVTFWDGSELTAEDVAYSLSRHLEPTSFWNIWFQNVQSIDVTGPLQVTVRLSAPDSLFNQFMATAGGAVGQRAFVEEAGRKYGTPEGGLMCTGPFRFGTWEPGQAITLEANDAYWDESLQPRVSVLRFQFITDPNALTNAILSEQVDGTYAPPVSSLSRLQESDVGNVYFGSSFLAMYVSAFENDGPLATDARIRQALSLSLDREAIARTIYGGAALPLRAIAPPATWGYSESTFDNAYSELLPTRANLAEARRLVEAAGSPTDEIVLAAQPIGEQVDLANVVAASAQEIGLNVRIEVVPPGQFAGLFFDPEAQRAFDGFVFPTASDIADPLETYVYTGMGDSFYNYAKIADPAAEQLVSRALETADEASRAELVTEAQAIIMDALPYIPIVSPYVVLFMNGRITGAPASYVFVYYPWAANLGGV